jgi:hypothetical protein
MPPEILWKGYDGQKSFCTTGSRQSSDLEQDSAAGIAIFTTLLFYAVVRVPPGRCAAVVPTTGIGDDFV